MTAACPTTHTKYLMLLTIDFETYWDAKTSLSKQQTLEYITDKYFRVHMCGVKRDAEPTVVYPAAELYDVFADIDWASTTVAAHNAMFDGSILAYHYDLPPPERWICTASLSRWALGKAVPQRHSLNNVAKYLGLPPKGTALTQSKGVKLLTGELYAEMADYCANDTDICHGIYTALQPYITQEAMDLMDWTVRCYTEPQLDMDESVLKKEIQNIQHKKEEITQLVLEKLALLAGAKPDKDDLLALVRSGPKFKQYLEFLGAEVPMKPGKRAMIPALAKTDPGMRSLLEHADPLIRTLAQLRLKEKSTIEETRCSRFLDLAQASASKNVRVPIPLRFAGATQTARWAGSDKINPQNLGKKSALRRALIAPAGHVVIACDLSNIEVRVLDTFSGQWDSVERFRAGEDPYVPVAAEYYNVPVQEVAPEQRQFGKVVILSCGYQIGAEKFRHTANYGWGLNITEQDAISAVQTYRRTKSQVVDTWALLQSYLPILATLQTGQSESVMLGDLPVTLVPNGIQVPSGYFIKYPYLKQVEGGWVYGTEETNIYGGKMSENLSQCLAGQVVSRHLHQCCKKLELRPALMVHDDLVFVVPKTIMQDAAFAIWQTMSKAPSWWPGLPVACEISIGENYADMETIPYD